MQKIRLKHEPKLEAKKDAFPFQDIAVEFAAEKKYAAIFYEQGLGKTKIAIDLILRWLENKELDTVIVVTKKGLVDNWSDEFQIHSYIKPKILSSNKSKNYFVLNSPARVIISNFEALLSDFERVKTFCRLRNVAIIVDESAKLKNPDSNLTKAYFDLSKEFKKRIIMTGTPIPNRPQDIWSQIYFLDGGKSLGSDYEHFKKSVDLNNKLYRNKRDQDSYAENVNRIFDKIKDFSIRETKDGSGLELPGKSYQNIICEWEEKQEELYREIKKQEKYFFVRQQEMKMEDAEVTIKRLTRLLQVTSNPFLINEKYTAKPGKFDYLISILNDKHIKNEKTIVWSSFVANCDWLGENLKRFNPTIIHGEMSDNARRKSLIKFKSDESCEVLVANPAAAKEGLTLTEANNVIFWDRSLSLDDYLQAQDRIHRISQVKDCYVYNLLIDESIDIWVDSLLNAKAISAKLAQQDIDLKTFKEQIDYSYGQLVKDVLDL